MEQGFPLTPENLSNMETAAVVLYVYRAINYRDIFGKEHETKYCFMFRPYSTVANPAPRGFYVDGPNGYNTAT
jgi:hypothetical protein